MRAIFIATLLALALLASNPSLAHNRARRSLGRDFQDKHVFKLYEFEKDYKKKGGDPSQLEQAVTEAVTAQVSRAVKNSTLYEKPPYKVSVILPTNAAEFFRLRKDVNTSSITDGQGDCKNFQTSRKYRTVEYRVNVTGPDHNRHIRDIELTRTTYGPLKMAGLKPKQPNQKGLVVVHFDGLVPGQTRDWHGNKVKPIAAWTNHLNRCGINPSRRKRSLVSRGRMRGIHRRRCRGIGSRGIGSRGIGRLGSRGRRMGSLGRRCLSMVPRRHPQC